MNNETCKSYLCRHCFQPRSAHSKRGAECPIGGDTRFAAEGVNSEGAYAGPVVSEAFAATEIQKLRAEVERLSKLLDELAKVAGTAICVTGLAVGEELAEKPEHMLVISVDRLRHRAEAAESKLSQLQLANEEKARKIYSLLHFDDITGMVDEWPTADGILAILNGGQQ